MKLCEATFDKKSQHRSCGLRALYKSCDDCPDVKSIKQADAKLSSLTCAVENALKTIERMRDALSE